ncbi:MAG: CcmD family protein [Bacteroidetes bacterium]|nr:CcmD family protein [Bacteroidota bacterium]
MVKKAVKHLSLAAIFICNYLLVGAQSVQDTSATIDSTMRSHDKIYVVMAVCIVILIVFFLYLIRIDLKVSKKEKSST